MRINRAQEAFVRNVNPCMSLISSLIADVTILCCATRFLLWTSMIQVQDVFDGSENVRHMNIKDATTSKKILAIAEN